MNGIIRTMTDSDIPAVIDIFRLGIESGVSTFRTECPSPEEWDKDHCKDCRLVYDLDGTVLGFSVISPTSSRECYRGVVEVSVYVHPEFHSNGIGTALLNELKSACEKAGYWTMFSVIFSTNTASIQLHEKCGFRKIGFREKPAKDKFGNWQDTVIMEYRNGII